MTRYICLGTKKLIYTFELRQLHQSVALDITYCTQYEAACLNLFLSLVRDFISEDTTDRFKIVIVFLRSIMLDNINSLF